MEKFMSVMVILFGVIAAVFLQCAKAQTVHVVGDSIGWTVPTGGASSYQTWAASKQFVVGDILCKIPACLCSLLSIPSPSSFLLSNHEHYSLINYHNFFNFICILYLS